MTLKNMPENTTYKFDTLLRYKLIEIISLWEGRLTTNHLCQTFGIGRQQASKEINTYVKNIAPRNLEYDSSLKGYKITKHFQPLFSQAVVEEYLNYLSELGLGESLIKHSYDQNHLLNFEIIKQPSRNISPVILSGLIRAIREKKRIELGYISLSNPKIEDRIIEPHCLVNTGPRWHIRAYCEKNRDFRDFVLSRFRGEVDVLDDALVSSSDDESWHTEIKIKLIPDTRLSSQQRKIIAQDYNMTRNKLIIKTRAALVYYVLKQYQIDPKKIEVKPEAQQLMIENINELEKWFY
ncbi:YafY family protein [Sessilibacter sp. MAH4]